MTLANTVNGPVSAALEADLRTVVQRNGIVIWLDIEGQYSAFVDQLKKDKELPYKVYGWRGSHLALLLELEHEAKGMGKPPLVIHLPGFNEETVKQTPLLELFFAGTRYWRRLDTLIEVAAGGRVLAEKIAEFRARPDVTLASADVWLQAQLKERTGEGFFAFLSELQPTAVLDDLLAGGALAERVKSPSDAKDIWERLAAWTGLSEAWREAVMTRGPQRAKDVAFVAASWALCVEYTDDLKRAARSGYLVGIRDLPKPVIAHCRAIAAHLRERHADFYKRTADETEALLPEELEAAKAEDLGEIDTFRFEEDRVLKAALAALHAEQWDQATAWAKLRVEVKNKENAKAAFWLKEDPNRLSAWQLVADAAALGQAIAGAGVGLGGGGLGGLEGAVAAYVEGGAAVDRAHRHLEQRRVSLLYPQLPDFETLRARLDGVRVCWQRWADGWAKEFNVLCRREGFLPGVSAQQRTLFDEVVKPLTQDAGITAYFLVDAFRYEMGEELYEALKDTGATEARIKARLAELPTVTEVGMNVLAPVAAQGKLSPTILNGNVTGFSTGEFKVNDPDTRRRAMHERVGGGACPLLQLEEVVSMETTTLKRKIAKAKLVVIHSREIDEAGEKGNGPAVFDHVMQKLRAAWRLLRDAGVKKFVLTADHGFLLLSEGTTTTQPHGRKIDPKRRYVFSGAAVDHKGEARVALSDLGYVGVDGALNVMFPESTALFDVGKRGASNFVHGGNSLQERVIPVLTLVHRGAVGGSTLQYTISATPREGVGGMHCLEIQLDVSQQSLNFGGSKEVELALRVEESADVQVELCQVRGGKARLAGGAIQAPVGEKFELFFRLSGSADARVLVELHHPSASVDVVPHTPEIRFEVTGTRRHTGARIVMPTPPAKKTSPTTTPATSSTSWLDSLPEGGVRELFAHLSAHGAVTEAEATAMLGSARELRKFSNAFEELAKKVPFAVRIDAGSGGKRYVRDGSNT